LFVSLAASSYNGQSSSKGGATTSDPKMKELMDAPAQKSAPAAK
jgi:hypothetical protein